MVTGSGRQGKAGAGSGPIWFFELESGSKRKRLKERAMIRGHRLEPPRQGQGQDLARITMPSWSQRVF